MKKNLVLAAIFVAGMVLNVSASGRKISSFREVKVTEGESAQIGGETRTAADIFYIPQADGTYEAVRFTVAPGSKHADQTLPYLNLATPTSININWKTGGVAENSLVRYGLSPDKLDMTVAAETRRQQRQYVWNVAKLTDLTPSTTYYYQVESYCGKSEVYTFHTMPQEGSSDKIRVLVVGDHQRSEHSDYEWLLSAAQQTVNAKYGEGRISDHINFLLNVGDQIDGNEAGLEPLWLYETVHLFKSKATAPYLPNMTAVGNHEYKGDPDLKLYDLHFHEYGDHAYKGITSGSANYYAYQVGSVLTIVLNSDDTGNADQKMWLRKVAAAATVDPTVTFIVSVQHRPLYAEQWTYDVSSWMRDQIVPILDATGKHVINCAGHHHLYARGQMNDSPLYHIISGGGVGTTIIGYEQLWGTTPDNFNHTEVEKTIDQWSYQILEFDPTTKTFTAECYTLGNSRLAVDNELADSFSRTLTPAELPARPEVVLPDGVVNLPFTFEQKDSAPAALRSTRWQIARDADFNDIVSEININAQDFYGCNDDFTPKNVNEGVNPTQYTIEDGTLANGTYFIRSCNRNLNLDWSEYSAPVEFTVEGATEPAAIATAALYYRPGADIKVDYKGAPVGTNAWVAIYAQGKTPGKDGDSLRWTYTDGSESSWTTSLDTPGAYFITMFKDGGYDECVARIPVVITDNCTDEDMPSIDTDKDFYNVGDPVEVKFINAPCTPSDWVGLYSLETSDVDNLANAKSESYTYIGSDPNGSVKLNVSGNHNYTSPVKDGYYYVAYAYNDGYYESMARKNVIVGSPVLLTLDKAEYKADEAPVVVWEGSRAWEGDCLKVLKNGVEVNSIDATKTNSTVLENLDAADYEVFVANGDNEISNRVSFKVSGETGIAAIETGTPTVKAEGNMLSVTSAEEINSVKVFTTEGKTLLSSGPLAAKTASFAFNAAPGVYLVQVNGSSAEKLVIK